MVFDLGIDLRGDLNSDLCLDLLFDLRSMNKLLSSIFEQLLYHP